MPDDSNQPNSAVPDRGDQSAGDVGGTAAYTKPAVVAGLSEAGQGAQVAQPGSKTPATEGPGTRIGPYKLLQEIGEGGMGTVFMAEQQEPVRRKVALKVIKAGMDSKEVLARFEAERQALALMDHPNIAKVLDATTTDQGRPYFVMELVKGIPITKYCDENQLTPRERLELFVPVCQAIQHAHQKGVIHRDIKPSNVLVASYDGKPVPKVIDFGVAKAMGQQLTEKTLFTAFGGVVGTLEYMSPEQAELNAIDIDTRSDIYGLGVLLYELLTGSTPLSRKRLKQAALNEALRLIREEEPPKPSTRLSSSEALPALSAQRKTEPAKLMKMMRGELDWIVMKALEKDRVRRYETANGFARDIERYLHDEPVEARPTSAGYRLRKFARRNKGPLAAAAFVLLALVAGVIGTTWGWFEAQDQRDAAQQARDAERERAGELAGALIKTEEAEQAEKRRAAELAVALKKADEATLLEKATREKAEGDLATSTMMLARSRFEQDNPGLAHDLLAQVPAKYRGSSWGLLKNYVAGSLFTLNGHTTDVTSVSYSPDGQTLASASSDGTVRLWDAISGQELRVLQGHMAKVNSVSYSPDGQALASASGNPLGESATADNTVRLWDTKSGQELRVLKGHTNIVNSVSYSPDGQTLASAGDNSVRLWDAKSGQELRVLKGHTNIVNSVSYSPDGQTLASASGDGTVRLWDALNGQALRVLKGNTGWVRSVSYSPDGQTLASASADGTVRLWDAKSGQVLRVLKGHTNQVKNVSYSPDGQTLASAGDNSVRLWDAKSGQELRVLKGHSVAVMNMSFSPDGQTLASAGDNSVRLWNAKSGQELRVLKGHTQYVTSVSYSPDGQTLASASVDAAVRLWDAQSTQKLRDLNGSRGFFQSASYSPDGQTLALASLDKTVRLWDAKSGQELRVLKGHTDPVRSVSFSPDGQVLASASDDKTVRLWDTKSGQELRVLKGHMAKVNSVSYSPDGQTLASASGNPLGESATADNTVRLWDTKSGQELRVLKGHTNFVSSVSYSPNGQTLASASYDQTVRLWDTKSGQELRALKGHTNIVWSVSYSPDGQTLASASWDKTVRLWDAKSGHELRVFKGHTAIVIGLSYSPDGQTLASASWDKTVRLWDVRSTWVAPGEPIPPSELAFRRWVTGPNPQWHLEKGKEIEKEKNAFAAAFHRSWEQHARGVLAFEAGDFNMAYAHFIAAAALKPKVPAAGK